MPKLFGHSSVQVPHSRHFQISTEARTSSMPPSSTLLISPCGENSSSTCVTGQSFEHDSQATHLFMAS